MSIQLIISLSWGCLHVLQWDYEGHFSQKLGQILCVSGQDGKGRLGRLIRVTAKVTDFCFYILLVFLWSNALHFPQTLISVFRLEYILLLMTMFYLVAIFLVTLNCIWLQFASGIMESSYHIRSLLCLFTFCLYQSHNYSALEAPHQIVCYVYTVSLVIDVLEHSSC